MIPRNGAIHTVTFTEHDMTYSRRTYLTKFLFYTCNYRCAEKNLHGTCVKVTKKR